MRSLISAVPVRKLLGQKSDWLSTRQNILVRIFFFLFCSCFDTNMFVFHFTGHYDFSCPTCGKGFQCKSYLMVHQRVHSDVKPYPCTTCGRNFKTKQSLLDHTNRHLGVKPYMCDICGRGFITKGKTKYKTSSTNGCFKFQSIPQVFFRLHAEICCL